SPAVSGKREQSRGGDRNGRPVNFGAAQRKLASCDQNRAVEKQCGGMGSAAYRHVGGRGKSSGSRIVHPSAGKDALRLCAESWVLATGDQDCSISEYRSGVETPALRHVAGRVEPPRGRVVECRAGTVCVAFL